MATPVSAEVCAAAGFDWVLLDLEHGAGGEEQVRDVVPAAGGYGVPTLVRVEAAERIRIGRVLDCGAAGHHAAPARQRRRGRPPRSRHLRYPPAGRPGRRHLQPGLPVRARPRGAGPGRPTRSLCVVQIESAAAVAAADDIAALDGVDVLFVGPRDLSHDLGVPGDITAPAYIEALDTRPRRGTAPRQGLRDARRRRRRRGRPAAPQGWSFLAIGSDSTLLAAAVARRARPSPHPHP